MKRTGTAARDATSAVSEATGAEPVEGAGERVEEAARHAAETVERASQRAGRGPQRKVGQELRQIMRDAAIEILAPAARRATTQAAKYAIARAPQVARDTIAPKLAETLKEAGGPQAFVKDALSSLSDARAELLEKVRLAAEEEARPWRERRPPVEESIDVAVPLETAYELFTEFDEYATFMSNGELVDERPNERITWNRTDREEATAVITFHRLSDRLTRVMVTYDYQPESVLERTTSMLRSARRGLRADLLRFKAFAELSEAAEEPEAEYEEQPAGEHRGEEREPPSPPHGPMRRRPAPPPRKARRR